MFVPVLGEARLGVALRHVENLPMDLGTVHADKDSIGDIEVGALVLAAFDAIGIVSIFSQQLLDKLGLSLGLSLVDGLRNGLWGLPDEGQVWVRRHLSLERLLVSLRDPSWLLVRGYGHWLTVLSLLLLMGGFLCASSRLVKHLWQMLGRWLHCSSFVGGRTCR